MQRPISLILLIFSLVITSFAWRTAGLQAAPASAPHLSTAAFDCTTVSEIPTQECNALVTLYNSTNGPQWLDQTNWLSTNQPCTWAGVTCFANQVTGLSLPNNGLNGVLPAELGNLTALRLLDLSYKPPQTAYARSINPPLDHEVQQAQTALQTLTAATLADEVDRQTQTVVASAILSATRASKPDGVVTSTLGITTTTTITAHRAMLRAALRKQRQAARTPVQPAVENNAIPTIAMPAALQGVARKTTLAAGVNTLTGPLPSTLGNLSSLARLDLSGNPLTGVIPPQLGKLTQLTFLNLTGHQFMGVIPTELGNLWQLQELDLTGGTDANGNRLGQLSGVIPVGFGYMPHLTQLALDNNYLSGSLPLALTNLTQLTYLNLYHNELTGGLPAQLGSMSSLQTLDLGANHFTGALPAALGKLSNLKIFSVAGNRLSGAIPPELGQLTNLTLLWLHINQFTGSIPPELGQLRNLINLRLNANQLSGGIPPELGQLTQLALLWLQNNQLTGPIPPELDQLINLVNLDLSENQLSGPIPTTLGNLTALLLLNLSTNNLGGPIPPSLGNLTNLRTLNLFSNQLTGGIPKELGQLVQLQVLNFDDNQLNGSIPPALGNLANLRMLGLLHNRLTGALPAELGNLPLLILLGLSNNELSGPLPPELGNLSQLQYLNLSANQLSGPIPPELGKLTQLTSFDLGLNQLSGPLPVSLGNLVNLDLLSLYNNQLSGPLPPEIGNLTRLTRLLLSANQLTGPIPPGLGQLSNLTLLWLQNNQLSGAIPPELGGLTNLTNLWLSNNLLAGPIPPELGNLVNLTELWLQDNQLSGAIPPELGNLRQLVGLWLVNNQLSGSIPSELGHLTALTSLGLQMNQLSGAIPAQLGALTQLVNMSLANNQLSGPLPATLGQLTQLQQLLLSTNALSGPIPPELGHLQNLTTLWLFYNQLSGPIPPQLANLTALTSLDLGVNQLSGPIPPVFGQLVNLRGLYLDHNQLGGAFPTATSPLTHLIELWLDHNQLDGALPTQWDGLRQLQVLRLHTNQFSGPLPAGLSILTNLVTLNLSGNAFSGVIPTELRTLTRLAALNVADNQLTATDANLLAFLQEKAPGWEKTQTLPPTNGAAHAAANNTIALTWTPIADTLNGGYYEVSYATSPNGPYKVHGKTVDKSVPGYTADNLAANTTYFFRVRTYTAPHTDQPNELVSDWSPVVNATTAASAANGDAQEPDDTCPQAKTLVADGSTQTHTFHQPGDVDWVQFMAQANTAYRIEVEIPSNSPADAALELYTTCGQAPAATFNESFSPGVRLDFTPDKAGPLYLKLTNAAANLGGATFAYQLSVRTLASEASTGAAIIVAGRYRLNDPLQTNIHNTTNAVYQLFRANGYSDEAIQYLASDLTLPGVDAAATLDNLRTAILVWVKDRVAADKTLTLYLMDHGAPGLFYLDNVQSQLLTPAELNRWLAGLEASVPGIKINLVIEACNAGSFIGAAPDKLSKAGRVILASTNPQNLAYASQTGATFSDALLTALRQGHHLFSGFWEARIAARQSAALLQDPWLDADGDGVPNELSDAAVAARRTVVAPSATLTATIWPPYITSAGVQPLAADQDGELQAVVSAKGTVARVWSVIYPPNYQPPTSGDQLTTDTAPTLELTANGNTYTGTYHQFNQPGLYHVVIHAEDKDGLVARPVEIEVQSRVTGAQSPSAVYLPLVKR